MKKSEMKDRFYRMFNETKNNARFWLDKLQYRDFSADCDIKHCYHMNETYVDRMTNYCTLAFHLEIISEHEFDECYQEMKSVNAYIVHID